VEKKQTSTQFKDLWYWMVVTTAVFSIIIISIPADLRLVASIRVLLGVLITLWLPGYSLTRLLFPNELKAESTKEIIIIERFAVSVGLSISLVSIISLILRYTPFASDYLTVLSLLNLSIIFSSVAWIRDGQVTTKKKSEKNEILH
jgi:uncharacterized membrane protein